jgi:hypothetical protein
MSTLITDGRVVSGLQIEHGKLEDLFAPRTVAPFTPPPTGIDNLGISSKDTFYVPGRGEFVVDFTGYVRVARSKPTTNEWTSSEVYTNLIEMFMQGQAEGIGAVNVTLHPDYVSTGQLRTPFEDLDKKQPEKACRMAVGAVFSLPQLRMKLFNKEPIELTIDQVRAIPPAGAPGVGRIYRMLPLFDMASPDAAPVAFLTALTFAMGTYLTESQLADLRSKLHGSSH